MNSKLEEIEKTVRKKKDIIVEETQSMTDSTPKTTRAFATGYIFAMQEVLIMLQNEKREQLTPAQLNSMFKPN